MYNAQDTYTHIASYKGMKIVYNAQDTYTHIASYKGMKIVYNAQDTYTHIASYKGTNRFQLKEVICYNTVFDLPSQASWCIK